MQSIVDLAAITPDDYAATVLPETFDLWGDGRTFERYVADFRAVATSAYGRRRPSFTVGIYEGDALVASCKVYDRELRSGSTVLRATGIGAVFTPARFRGRGYATAMLGALLDSERDAGRDLAYLYSDIHPAFYAKLGFIALPSRLFTVGVGSLDGSAVGAKAIDDSDWTGIRRCFDALDGARPWSFRRTPLIWNWMRGRWAIVAPPGVQSVGLVVRRSRSIVAYAIGRRLLHDDTFALDDFAYDGDVGAAAFPGLLRAAAGDLRRVGGWLPPAPGRELLPRGSVRARKTAILMIAPLSPLARTWWATYGRETLASKSDATWSSDHI